tara:strand:- start:28610 stop:29311 length:702 start_codon:yes stop_codon:yes gene_type:complete
MKKKSSKPPIKMAPIPVPDLPKDLYEMSLRENLMKSGRQIRSETPTPKGQVKKKQDFDYVEEGWMRHQLNEHFPNWSWLPAGDTPVQFLGSEWVIVSGSLVINDNGVQRNFFSPGSQRIMFKKGQPHTAENVVDIDNNVAAANSNALKRAINRLTNIADDVYRKQILELGENELAQINDVFENILINDAKNKDKILKVQIDYQTLIKSGRINILNYLDAINSIKEQFNYKENN